MFFATEDQKREKVCRRALREMPWMWAIKKAWRWNEEIAIVRDPAAQCEHLLQRSADETHTLHFHYFIPPSIVVCDFTTEVVDSYQCALTERLVIACRDHIAVQDRTLVLRHIVHLHFLFDRGVYKITVLAQPKRGRQTNWDHGLRGMVLKASQLT